MMAVDVMTKPAFSAGKPKLLFEASYGAAPGGSLTMMCPPNGQRFLMLKPSEGQAQAAAQINVVLNWFEELKRKVPAK
jgi:hypothetical protein